GSSFPREACRSLSFSGPPAAASARLAARSATNARMAAALALNSSDETAMDDLIFGMLVPVRRTQHVIPGFVPGIHGSAYSLRRSCAQHEAAGVSGMMDPGHKARDDTYYF